MFNLIDYAVVILTKLISNVSILLAFGAGETWPGEIALRLRPNIAASLAKDLKYGVILVAGTNGKTTTSLMLKTILEHQGLSVVHNATGANLLNGIVSSLIKESRCDWGIFEVDENSLPIVLRYITPKRIVLLNLFRDQLDRYGEVDVIMEKWLYALSRIPRDTTLILNSDDPGIATLGSLLKGDVTFFGINNPKEFLNVKEHATDSTFCPKCGNRLRYDGVYFSHLGVWNCEKCGNTRPKPTVTTASFPLSGLYNQYNALAAFAVVKTIGIRKPDLSGFSPAFGRQEELAVDGHTVKIFLSKNPAGFNASLRTVLEMGAKNLLLVLNDRIPDGRDVSWIWDVDFETIPKKIHITVSGDRVYDMALRIKYAERNAVVEPNLEKALESSGDLYVLATYSAMLEVRKILTGRKIL